MFGAAVGATIVTAVTDTGLTLAVVIGALIGVVIVAVSYIQDRERN